MNYNGKNIWITGASSGIGEALALEYVALGANVIISSRNSEKLIVLAERCKNASGNMTVIQIDLTDPLSIESAVKQVKEKFDKLDILVNNGGVSQRSLAKETSIDIDRKIMETNFFGAISLTKLVLPILMNANEAKIVVISSVVGKFGFPLRTAYSASKHALQGYFEALRAELHNDNIKVIIVSPGRIQTNISVNAIDKDGKKHGIMDKGQEGGMPVQLCAKKIIDGVKKNKKEIWVGGKEVIMVYIRKFLPFLFHIMARKVKPT